MGIADTREVWVPITEEAFDAAYVLWKVGASVDDLVPLTYYGVASVAWCLIMRSADRLGEYTVHFKDPNSSTN